MKSGSVTGRLPASWTTSKAAPNRRRTKNPVAVRRRPSQRDKVAFLNALATLLQAYVPVSDALQAVAASTSSQGLQDRILAAERQVRDGLPLGEALTNGELLPQAGFSYVIRVGEESGHLPDAMDHLARLAERSAVLRRRVRSALAYPLFVCLVAVAAIVFLLIVIVPTFAEMYSGFGAELPQATQHLVSISRAMTRGWFVWIGILGFIIAVGARLARSDGFRRSMDQALARLPIVGRLIGQRDAAAFSRAMATMLENGVSVEVALSLASNTASSSVARSEIVRALGHVRSGRSVGDALGEAVSLPDLLRTMVVAGDLSGRLEVVFAKAADHYEHELSAALDTLVSLIEPTIILVLGGILAWVLAALYLPMFDLATIMQ